MRKSIVFFLILSAFVFTSCESLKDDVTFTKPIELSYDGVVGTYKITSLKSIREDFITNLNGDIFEGYSANSVADNIDLRLEFNRDSTYNITGDFILNTEEYRVLDNDTINISNTSRINTVLNSGTFEIFIDNQDDIREIILDPGFNLSLDDDVNVSEPLLPIYYFFIEDVESFSMVLEDVYSNSIQRTVDRRTTTLKVEKQ